METIEFEVMVLDADGDESPTLAVEVADRLNEAGWTTYYRHDNPDGGTFIAKRIVNDVYEALFSMMHVRISLYDTVPECDMRFRRYNPELSAV